jgi:hypothetical protein
MLKEYSESYPARLYFLEMRVAKVDGKSKSNVFNDESKLS